jgi:hypothetical protein
LLSNGLTMGVWDHCLSSRKEINCGSYNSVLSIADGGKQKTHHFRPSYQPWHRRPLQIGCGGSWLSKKPPQMIFDNTVTATVLSHVRGSGFGNIQRACRKLFVSCTETE